MKAAGSSKTSNFYQTTWRHIQYNKQLIFTAVKTSYLSVCYSQQQTPPQVDIFLN